MSNLFNRSGNSLATRSISRRSLLKSTLAASAGVFALSTFGGNISTLTLPSPGPASAAALTLDSDLDVLNYALTLEYLESAAYRAINDAGVLSGRADTYFRAFGEHEDEHVEAIIATIRQLGGTPVDWPQFDFSSVPTEPDAIVEFFQGVEALGASAYHGAAPSIQNLDILDAALSIHAVEAEHAAALADLVAPGSSLFSPAAFAIPRTPDEVLAIIQPFLPTMMPGMPATGHGGAHSASNRYNSSIGYTK